MVGSGLATLLGGVALLAFPRPSPRALDLLLGFTAGVMLAAAIFSLLLPALERGTAIEALGGFALGAAVLAALDFTLPHAHARLHERRHPAAAQVGDADTPVRVGRLMMDRRALLLLAAMTIHNVPEGLSVGVAFAAGSSELGIPVALGIGIQNIPEGFAAAAPLIVAGTHPRTAACVAGLTGLIEPPAALLGFAVVGVAAGLLPVGLGFAAGAMIYVVVDELIPESHAAGRHFEPTIALLAGFILMTALDVSL